MFDLGWSEFLIVSVVTIVVVGPKEIPRVIKTISTGMRKARSYASDFQRSVMEVADMEDLNDIRKTLTAENESLNKDFKNATADMDAIRKQWETDWDAELQKTTADINAELEIDDIEPDTYDFLKPKKDKKQGDSAKKTKKQKATAKKKSVKRAKTKKVGVKKITDKSTEEKATQDTKAV